MYHATASTTKVTTPPQTGRRSWLRVIRRLIWCSVRRSIGAIREGLQLWIGVDHLHVFVGDELVSRGRFGERAVRLHECADLGKPAVDFGRSARGAVHDLELLCEVVGRT